MKLWLICGESRKNQLLEGRLISDAQKVDDTWRSEWEEESSWTKCYSWLADQMDQRIGKRPADVKYPIFLWCQHGGENKKMPDARLAEYRRISFYRITLEVPDELVLLSNFDTWHCVLNNCPCCSEEEDKWYEEQMREAGFPCNIDDFLAGKDVNPIVPESLEMYKRKTWERIFDFDWYDEYVASPWAESAIQATVWELKAEWVKKVEYFERKVVCHR